MISKRATSITLLSLLLAGATCGAAAMFMGNGPIAGQTIGTVIAATVVVTIIMSICHRLEWSKDATTIVGTITVLGADFCCLMLGVWTNPGYRLANLLAMFAAIVSGTGIPACFYLFLRVRPYGRWAGRVGLVASAVGFIVWSVAAVASYNHDQEVDAYGNAAGAIVGFGVPLVISLIGVGTDRRWWRWIGVAAAAGAIVVGAANLHQSGAYLFPLGSLAMVVAIANGLASVPLPPVHRWLAWLTTALVGATAVIYNVGLAIASRPWSPDHMDEMYSRVTGAGVFLSAGGLLALAVLVRVNRGSRKADDLPPTVQMGDVLLVCPMCQTSLKTANGVATCGTCGLKLHVRVEEPRCAACGYSLLMNHADRCPECGVAATFATPPIDIPAVPVIVPAAG